MPECEERSQNGLGDVTAVILAGGLGTRLRSVVADRPKVLAEVHGRPFLAYLFDLLADAGVGRAILCTGYKGEQVAETFGSSYRGMRLDYSQEEIPLGTAGAIRLARSRFALQTVLAMNGDSYCSTDFRRFYAWHCRKDFAGSLLLTQVTETSRYGRVQIDDNSQVLSFDEKGSDCGAGWINAGVYILSPGLLSEIPMDGVVSLEREMLPVWIRHRFGGYRSESQFLDIGLPESYAETEQFFAPWPARKMA